MRKPEAIILCDSPESVMKVFGHGRLEKLAKLVNLHHEIISGKELGKHKNLLTSCRYIFSTWGMPALDAAQISAMKNLKAVFYAAGSVKYFAEPFLKRGIRVISAWGANAKPTAAFALGQVLLSCKGYFGSVRNYKATKADVWSISKEGFYGCKCGIIGAGKVGSTLAELLKPFGIEVFIADPYLSVRRARQLGAVKTSLKHMFKDCLVISNHMPDIKTTKGVLGAGLFGSMPPDATFINTGRGAQVDEAGLIRVLRKRKDLTALLDVTYPEPPVKNSALFKLPNVIISPHIAGAYGKEQVLLADCVIDECSALIAGKPWKYEVKLKMLERMG